MVKLVYKQKRHSSGPPLDCFSSSQKTMMSMLRESQNKTHSLTDHALFFIYLVPLLLFPKKRRTNFGFLPLSFFSLQKLLSKTKNICVKRPRAQETDRVVFFFRNKFAYHKNKFPRHAVLVYINMLQPRKSNIIKKVLSAFASCVMYIPFQNGPDFQKKNIWFISCFSSILHRFGFS